MKNSSTTSKKTVLIVDDDADLALLLKVILEKDGMRVITSRNGSEALIQIANLPLPDLIFADLRMPQMSGAEFIEKLREGPKTREIPVIVASGEGNLSACAARVNAQGHLSKPFHVDAVRALARQHLFQPKFKLQKYKTRAQKSA